MRIKKSFLIGMMIGLVILIILISSIKDIGKRWNEVNIVTEYEQEATITYCGGYNICNTVEVESFNLVYIQRFTTITHYIQFEVNGETRLSNVERTKVVKGVE